MRIYLLTANDMADNITVLNLTRKGKSFLVSKAWYRFCVFNDFIDKCDFNIKVGKDMYHPQQPFEL